MSCSGGHLGFRIGIKNRKFVEDFKKAVSHIAPHLPTHTIELSFRELDRDGDRRVSYKDFEFMMKYNLTDHI